MSRRYTPTCLGIGPNRQVTFRNLPRPMLFAKTCCLADIPIIHLGYHANRYGKIAIGYHRDAVLNVGFQPKSSTNFQTQTPLNA